MNRALVPVTNAINETTLMHVHLVILLSTCVSRDGIYLLSNPAVMFCVTRQRDWPVVMSSFSIFHARAWMDEREYCASK